MIVTLFYDEGVVAKVQSSPFIVKGNRRQKMKRSCTTLRESLSVTTVIDHPTIVNEAPTSNNIVIKPPPLHFLPKFEEELPLKRLPQSSFYPVRRTQPLQSGVFSVMNQVASVEEDSPIVLPPIRTEFNFRSPSTPELPVQRERELVTQGFASSSGNNNGSAGPYSPEDYSIPPDEEYDREDYHDQESGQLIRLELPQYYIKSESGNYRPRLEPPENPEPKRRCLSLYNGYGYDSMVNKRFQPL